jgi:hypothetical protein
MLATLLDLESQVWDALVRGDDDADQALLSAEFLGVYATGFAGRECHVDQLAEGPTVLSYKIEQPRIIELSRDASLIAYRATYTRPAAPEIEKTMYVSSIWSREGDTWRNLFSQDTDAS